MEEQWKNITTSMQLFFYLEKGEIIAFKLTDAECYMTKEDKKYKIIIQPNLGASREYIHKNKKMIEKFFNDMREVEIDFWVLPGATLDNKKLTIAERVVDFFRNKKERS